MKSDFWLPNIVRLVNQAVLEARSYPWHLQRRPQTLLEWCGNRSVPSLQTADRKNALQVQHCLCLCIIICPWKGSLVIISYLHACLHWLFDKLFSENMYYMSSWTAVISLENNFHLQIALNITWLIALIKNKCKIFIFNESIHLNTQKRSDNCVLACPMYIIVSWLLLQKTINILYM